MDETPAIALLELNTTSGMGNDTSLCINRETWGTPIVLVECSFIVIGNLFVLLVLSKYPSRRFRPLNFFIVQLALADLCVGGIVFWIGFLSSKVLSHVTLISGAVVYGILATATSASTLGVLCIAVDRYIYILRHHSYRKIMTKAVVTVLIVSSWTAPALVFILIPVAGWNCIESCDCSIYNQNMDTAYCIGETCSQMMTPFKRETLLIGGVCLLTLLLASVVIYILLILQVRLKTKQPVKYKQRKVSEMRMIKTMVIVLGGFLLTTGPLAFLCIVSYIYNVRQLHLVMRIMVVISNVNSIMNPFFYFWRIPYMNRNLTRLWHSFIGCFKGSTLRCARKTTQRRTSSAQTTCYAAGAKDDNGCTDDSMGSTSGSKIQYLNKTIRINFGKTKSTMHTPWSSSGNVL